MPIVDTKSKGILSELGNRKGRHYIMKKAAFGNVANLKITI